MGSEMCIRDRANMDTFLPITPKPSKPIVLPCNSLDLIGDRGHLPLTVPWCKGGIFLSKESEQLITYSATESAFMPVAG